jgi:hypothetical protein
MPQSAKPQSLTNDRLITKWSPCSETPLISTLTSSKSTTKRQSLRKHIQTNHCRKNPSELREFASVQCETKGKKARNNIGACPHTHKRTHKTYPQPRGRRGTEETAASWQLPSPPLPPPQNPPSCSSANRSERLRIVSKTKRELERDPKLTKRIKHKNYRKIFKPWLEQGP